MSILDINKEYDPISPIYINEVLGFRHLISFTTHIIWAKDFMYGEKEFSQGSSRKYYQIHINKFFNAPTDCQWSVQSCAFGDAPDNIYVNDVNELRIAIEAIKNKHKI